MTVRLEDTPVRVDDQGRVIPGPTHNDLADQLQVFMSELELRDPKLYAEHRQMLEDWKSGLPMPVGLVIS